MKIWLLMSSAVCRAEFLPLKMDDNDGEQEDLGCKDLQSLIFKRRIYVSESVCFCRCLQSFWAGLSFEHTLHLGVHVFDIFRNVLTCKSRR